MNFENVKNYVDRMFDEYKVPGVDCIVFKEHEQVFRYCAGKSDLESGKKLDGSELYFIFSMTKMITCVSALQLLEKGRYLLLDPVSKYLPEFAESEEEAPASENPKKAQKPAPAEIVP